VVLVSAILPLVLPSTSSGSRVPRRCTPADDDSGDACISPSKSARGYASEPCLRGLARSNQANLDRDAGAEPTNLDRDAGAEHTNLDRDAGAEPTNLDRDEGTEHPGFNRDASAEHANLERDASTKRSRCLGEQISAEHSSGAKRRATAE
jgi:hypothetical protein